MLLTATLFLVSAPSPDSKDVSEISAGFMKASNDLGLMAAESAASAESLVQSSAKELAPENKPEWQIEAVATAPSEQAQTN